MDKSPLILLVDDDADDRDTFADVCRDLNQKIKLKLFKNGSELLTYLNLDTTEIPSIIFLDINMPVKNGFESLGDIRNKSKFSELCIIIYSTSIANRDIDRAKALGANGFLEKPSSFKKLKSCIQKILNTDWKEPCAHLDELEFVIT